MSSVITPRLRSTAYSSSPKSSPTGPITRVSARKLEASAKCTAAPPSRRGAPVGLRLDGVERDRSHHGQAHEGGQGIVRPVRAIRISEWGGPEVLELVEDAPVPEPGEGQVLVRVSRAGINFADTHARENSYLARYELPLIPGAEVAGVVESTGQRVVALVGTGGYAEYVAADEATMFPIPDGVSDATALALLLQGLTAWHLYRTSAKLASGESVVVHAAAGGVGSLAVQLGRQMGAGRVIATASSEEKRELARSLGADAAVDVNAEDLAGALIEANGGERVDVGVRDGGRARVRRVDEGARAVRAARHLRHRLARAERGPLRRADAPQPRRRRLLADALPAQARRWSRTRCASCSSSPRAARSGSSRARPTRSPRSAGPTRTSPPGAPPASSCSTRPSSEPSAPDVGDVVYFGPSRCRVPRAF